MKIKFIGAAREVTGSKHLIITDSGKKILLDCGMFQGKGLETDGMNRDLMFDPSLIDHIILTHAPVSYTHLRAHETPEHLVCRLLLEKKKKKKKQNNKKKNQTKK